MKKQEREALMQVLGRRFEKNPKRHRGVAWDDVLARLDANPKALESLRRMEATGGEPDVIARDAATGRTSIASRNRPGARTSPHFERRSSLPIA